VEEKPWSRHPRPSVEKTGGRKERLFAHSLGGSVSEFVVNRVTTECVLIPSVSYRRPWLSVPLPRGQRLGLHPAFFLASSGAPKGTEAKCAVAQDWT